ncbi:MAG: PrsW family intramembrane metalloprotease [Phycisphaerales bacterium]|nr:PrsW family intramembrane metalloprotease [Phycisphaerales bacterium]
MLVHAVILYSMLIACGVLFIWLVRRHDLLPREPWLAIISAGIFGALTMWLSGRFQNAVIPAVYRLNEADLTTLQYAALAGLTEEISKLAAVGILFILFRSHFNEAVDGLMYGSLVGLGAAVEESIAFFMHQRLEPFPLTEPVRLFGHLVMGGITCAGVGAVAARWRRGWLLVPVMWAAGAGVHTVWDVIAFSASEATREPEGVRPWHTALSIAIMFIGYLIYRGAVEVAVRHDRRQAA